MCAEALAAGMGAASHNLQTSLFYIARNCPSLTLEPYDSHVRKHLLGVREADPPLTEEDVEAERVILGS